MKFNFSSARVIRSFIAGRSFTDNPNRRYLKHFAPNIALERPRIFPILAVVCGWVVVETQFMIDERPNFIKHFSEIQGADNSHYPGSNELLSIGAPFGKFFGFKRLGIHYEVLPPGRRTSWPHAEKTEEEFVFVIEGNPDVWIDGKLYPLKPGDGVGFVPGTGMAHTFMNNTETEVRLLVVGDTNREDNKCHYPLHPERNRVIGDFHWKDIPQRDLGPHDGLPNRLRR